MASTKAATLPTTTPTTTTTTTTAMLPNLFTAGQVTMCPCCGGPNAHAHVLGDLLLLGDLSALIRSAMETNDDSMSSTSDASGCADADAVVAEDAAEDAGADVDESNHENDDDDDDKDKEEEDYDGAYFNDNYDSIADEYEDQLYNKKRGGCRRSTAATKTSHKQDSKMRRQIRSRHIAAHCKTLPLRPHARSNRPSYKSADLIGDQIWEERQNRLEALRMGGTKKWRDLYQGDNGWGCCSDGAGAGASAGAGSRGGHAQRDDHPQAQAFALHNGHDELSNLMVALQHRELTAEDYELLLRLDESVKPKTVAATVLTALPVHTFTATPDTTSPPPFCSVCQCDIETGESVKTLPCGHPFHVACIDQWLASAADRCPVDGVAVKTH